MQVTRRVGLKIFVWMAVVALFLAVFSISSQAKKGRFLEIPGCAYRDDKTNDIYYAYERGGLRMGITKYNPKTKTEKCIFDVGENERGRGFYDITIKGDYIYFIWDKAGGSGEERESYLYRVKKNGKGLKLLAKANNYVIKGNQIYYFDSGLDFEDEWLIDEKKTNMIRKMNLDGSNKKKVKKLKGKDIYSFYWLKLALYEGELVYHFDNDGRDYYYLNGKKIKLAANTSYKGTIYCGYDDRGGSVMINGYKYYWEENKNTLYRKSRNNKINKIIEIKSNTEYGGRIENFTVCGNYVLVRCYGENLIRNYYGDDVTAGAIYVVRADGKEKQKLREWELAE